MSDILYILYLKCPACNMIHDRTEKMRKIDIKRNWEELVLQKDLVNSQEFSLCCGIPLEYYPKGA